MDRRTEQKRMTLPGYQVMGLCAGCAEKLGKIRPMEKVPESERWMQCGLCYLPVYGESYKIYPPTRTQHRKRSGGGERAASGR